MVVFQPSSLEPREAAEPRGGRALGVSLCRGTDLGEGKQGGQWVREGAAESPERLGPQEASPVSPNFLGYKRKGRGGRDVFSELCEILLM